MSRASPLSVPCSACHYVSACVRVPCLLGLLWSSRAATPGSTLPSNSSSEAPPPVEMCDIWLATPAFSTADTESPPPMMVVQPYSYQPPLSGYTYAQFPAQSCLSLPKNTTALWSGRGEGAGSTVILVVSVCGNIHSTYAHRKVCLVNVICCKQGKSC